METLNIPLKTLTLFFMAMTLLQSCIAYQKTPVSLPQAEQSKKQVKIYLSSNQTDYYKQIVKEEKDFYGIKKQKGEIVKIAIPNDGTSEVFLHSKKRSAWATVATILVPVSIFAIWLNIYINENGLGTGNFLKSIDY